MFMNDAYDLFSDLLNVDKNFSLQSVETRAVSDEFGYNTVILMSLATREFYNIYYFYFFKHYRRY